jgi:hypothetical protein
MTTPKKTEFYQRLTKHKDCHKGVASKEITPDDFLSVIEQTFAQDPSCSLCYPPEEITVQFAILKKALATLSYIKGFNQNTQQRFEELLDSSTISDQLQISLELVQTLRYHPKFWESITYTFETVVREVRIFQEETNNFLQQYKPKNDNTPPEAVSNLQLSTPRRPFLQSIFGTTPYPTPTKRKAVELVETDQE